MTEKNRFCFMIHCLNKEEVRFSDHTASFVFWINRLYGQNMATLIGHYFLKYDILNSMGVMLWNGSKQ